MRYFVLLVIFIVTIMYSCSLLKKKMILKKELKHSITHKFILFTGLVVLVFIPSICFSQIDEIFGGIKMSDDIGTVKQKMETYCASMKEINAEVIIFPLAQNREQHLICTDCNLYDYFFFNKLAFTFSDNKMNFISAYGDGVYKLLDNEFYKGYKFYTGKDNMVINEKDSLVMFLTEEGLHTNLFAWKNPYLSLNKETVKYSTSAKIPEVFKLANH